MQKPKNKSRSKAIGELNRVLGVSMILMAGRIGGVAANFLLTLLLARLMAPEDLGVVILIISTSMLASILTTLNVEAGSIRHLLHARETGDAAGAAGFVLFTRRFWLYASPAAVLTYLTVAYFVNPDLLVASSWVLIIGAATIPFIGLLRLNTRQATVLSHQLAGVLPSILVRPVLLVAFVGLAALVGLMPTPTLVLVIYLVTTLAAAFLQFHLLRGAFRFIATDDYSMDGAGLWVKTGMLLTGSLIITEYFQDVTLTAAALALPPQDIAKLAIALRLVGFLKFGMAAVNIAIGPKVATALANEDRDTCDRILALASQVKIWSALVAIGLLVAFGRDILGIFGPDYVGAVGAFRWLLLIPIVMAVLGPNEVLLNTTGNQKDIFLSALVAIALAIIVIPLGGQWFGLEGAAAAAVASFSTWEALNFVRVRCNLGIDASLVGSFKFLARDLLMKR